MSITSSMAANNTGNTDSRRFFSVVLFLCYLLLLSYFLFFSEGFGRVTEGEYRYNLILFHEIKRFIKYANLLGWKAVAINIFGNVIAFMPFGYYISRINKKAGPIKVTLESCIFSLIIEITQLHYRLGSFDVDDIFLNTLGGILGYIVFYLIYGRRHTNAKKTSQ